MKTENESEPLSRPSAIETFGEVFSDNAMIDLVRTDTDSVQLLFWDGLEASISPCVNKSGKDFIPSMALDKNLLRVLQLPTHVSPYHSTKQLYNDLGSFFAQHLGLPDESVSIISYFVIATLFPECATILPSLSIVAPDPSGLALLLRMLRCVCRRSLHLVEPSVTGILSLPFSLRPTLLIEEARPTHELQRTLRAMSHPGAFVSRNRQLLEIGCSTVVCSAEPVTDPWLLDNIVQVVLTPGCGRLPKLDEQSLREVANELTAKLLQYRLSNFVKVRQSQFDASELSLPTADLARTFGTCIVDDEELQSRLIQLFAPQDEETRARHSALIPAVVIESALVFCHEKGRESVYAGEITKVVNTIMEGRGENLRLEDRAIGDVLRSLGLFTQRLGSAGRGLLLLRDVQRTIHRLAHAFDVRSIQDGVDRCAFCTEVRLAAAQK